MRFFPWVLSVSLLLSVPALRAATPDQMYIEAFRLIQQADNLSSRGQKDVARERYQEARENLEKLQKSYPSYNKTAVHYRLNYVNQQTAALPEAAKPRPAQPAAPADPSQSLQARVAELESQNQLLQAKLQEALKAQPAAVDPRSLAEAEERIKQLEKEKELLRAALEKAEAAEPQAADKAMLDQARAELEATREKLSKSVAEIATLTRERQGLENELAAVAELKNRVEQLEMERTELQAELSRLGSQPAAPAAAPDNSARVKELEAERDNLQKKLNDATRQLNDSKSRGQSSSTDATQIANLRARLEIFEARKVPYTQEELALLDQSSPSPRLAADIKPGVAKRSIRELPSGSALLVAEAERAFAARRFDEAEAKYQQVLEMDEDNPVTLANIAAIQLELGKLAEAEANLNRAISADADDSYAHLLMGMVRLRQDKFQEALDSLGRSAQLDPKNAESQNYIGVALSQLGQREAAETALRKAIAMRPNYAGAHHNLAFIYATQRPPAVELAKFHYNKALASGHPRNPDLEKELSIEN